MSTPHSPKRWLTLLSSALALLAACSERESGPIRLDSRPTPTATTTTTTTSTTAPAVEARLVAAGDIACRPDQAPTERSCQQAATATLVESLNPDVVLPLGDLQYDRGEASSFAAVYDSTWGRFKSKTRPVIGNHEYAGGKAPGYYGYFGDAAHPPTGWYSFDITQVGWHVIVLDSNCGLVGCGEGSAQLEWLRDDLAAHASKACVLAAFHHPRWSSGLHGSTDALDDVWRALATARADLVLSGHDHHYERIAVRDGLRQFIVGTGGHSHYPVVTRIEGSEFVDAERFGVLELTLRSTAYKWRFVAAPGGEVVDEGQESCR